MAYTTIKKPSDYFNTKLYTGDGNTTQAITGVGFQPDFTWLKNRSDAGGWHRLSDGVRGVTKLLYSNATSAEVTTDANGYIASFDSDGLTVNLGSSGTGTGTNSSGHNFVAWNWLASNTTASNTDGSITSTVSANTTSGFSIVQYTGNGTSGATFGHGLGVMPSHIIIKRTSSAEAWVNWHSTFSALQYLRLYQSTAIESSTNLFNNTLPTSSVVSLGTGGFTNTSGETYIAYCFAEKTGYSKFGSYTGNGSADGTFVYTGFKPAFVLIKNTSVTQSWHLIDNKRLGYNPKNYIIQPNVSQAESSLEWIDMVSNGFKHRNNDPADNASGNNYIYAAFAEEPLVGDNPATAR